MLIRRAPNTDLQHTRSDPSGVKIRPQALAALMADHPVYTPAPVLNSYPSILTISRPFNSLFRVLFTFPSQYLFAIGLGSIFSLGRNLPPIFTQDSQPELLEDNVRSVATVVQCSLRGYHPLWRRIPERTWNTRQSRYTRRPQTTIRPPLGSRFSAWALAASLAVTGAIAVAFFSCP